VLLVLVLEVAQLAVELVEAVLLLLDLLVRILDLRADLVQRVILVGDDVLHGDDALVVVVHLRLQDLYASLVSFELLVQAVLLVFEFVDVLALLVALLLLIAQQARLELILLPQVEVALVLDARLLPHFRELDGLPGHFLLGLSNHIDDALLLLLGADILVLEHVKLPDEPIDFDSVLADLVEAVALDALLLDLDLLVLVLEVPELVLEGVVVALSVPQLLDLALQLGDEELLVLRDALRRLDGVLILVGHELIFREAALLTCSLERLRELLGCRLSGPHLSVLELVGVLGVGAAHGREARDSEPRLILVLPRALILEVVGAGRRLRPAVLPLPVLRGVHPIMLIVVLFLPVAIGCPEARGGALAQLLFSLKSF